MNQFTGNPNSMCPERATNDAEQAYLDLLKDILDNGEDRIDRTGVGTRAVFGRQLRFDLKKGFPLLTTKKTSLTAILGEILWFVEGSGDERRLAEITYGTRDVERTTIWTANAEAGYWKHKAQFPGDLGRVYGVQWRNWRSPKENMGTMFSGTSVEDVYSVKYVDQIATIVNTLKTNPTDRRMILTAFNPGELDQMALPPCHMFAQFFVDITNRKLSCQMYMRSVDTMLGLPFNVASYAVLTHMLARSTDLDVGELIISMGDTHIYSNHFEGAREQISRCPLEFPTLLINPHVKDIDGFSMSDFELVGYSHHPAIKLPMAV